MIIKDWEKMEFRGNVFVSGCFDILHPGHVKLLEYAARHGSLLVGVNSDESVFSYKHRLPTLCQDGRIAIINALRCVDLCFIFDFRDARDVVKIIKPRLWVLGDDHAKSKFDGLPCPVLFFRRDGNSSSNIKRIIGAANEQKALATK